MRHIFREYDIRGIFDKDLNEKSVKTIGYLLGRKILLNGINVAVGYDARTHSKTLFNWLVSGLNYAGLKVQDLGLVPTPCNYFAGFFEQQDRSNATIMITGSHNPPEYNGFKITIDKLPFFGKDITDLGSEVILNIDSLNIPDDVQAREVDVLDRYTNFLLDHFKHLEGLKTKIVIDCGNGTAGVVIEKLVKGLHLDAKILFAEPDGTFPNHHPDPTEEKNLKSIKSELKQYDIGFAFDGDADRIAVLTQKNNFKGDELVIFYSKMLKNPQILGEVKCSQVMYDEINRVGHAYMYKTGHSNLKMKMRELSIDIAAEVSGHIFFNDRYFGYDDAIYAMLRTLELLQNGFDLDGELAKLPKVYSTDELKIGASDEEKFEIIDKLKIFLNSPPKDFPKIIELINIDGVRIVFEDGWGLVRASNTTPLIIARFEAKSKEKMEYYQSVVEKALSAIQMDFKV